jgi:hypothetical protein
MSHRLVKVNRELETIYAEEEKKERQRESGGDRKNKEYQLLQGLFFIYLNNSYILSILCDPLFLTEQEDTITRSRQKDKEKRKRLAVVTGSSSGIEFEIAIRFASWEYCSYAFLFPLVHPIAIILISLFLQFTVCNFSQSHP